MIIKGMYGSTLLREVTSRPPFCTYDVVSNSDSVSRYVFTWRTILPTFIPIRFEMTEH